MDKITAGTHVSVDVTSPFLPHVRATKAPATEEQLDWVEQLQVSHLIVAKTRSGKSRLAPELLACAPHNSRNKNEGSRNG